MWKEYSRSYLKNNRSSGLSIMIAAFISALLLSLLCGLFYNAWKYEVERIELEEGGWQSRIIGEFHEKEIESIKNFANVKQAVLGESFLDLYFEKIGDVLEDTPQIAETLGASAESVVYHDSLLSMYLTRSLEDTAPRMVFPLFFLITLLASLSLVVIIHNSFAVSMNARIHQFGIFSSVGATPKQIRTCLLQEAAGLCAVPVIIGNAAGILLCKGVLQMVNVLLGKGIEGRHPAAFGYHPMVFFITLFATVFTVWISAWIPAKKMSRLTPLEAMKNTGDFGLKRKKHSRILNFLFGIEGELAGNALKAQRKAMRTATVSLLFSFMAFTLMECFFVLSGISTRETYFERYQDVWDIMVTVKDTPIDDFAETEEIRNLSGVESAIAYQKAMAKALLPEDAVSEEMKGVGGFSHAKDGSAEKADQGYLVNAPVVILDDASFLHYCRQIGIEPKLSGAVIRNEIRDVTNPDFRHPEYVPYLKGEADVSILRQAGKEKNIEVPVLAYTEKEPVLREDYATLDYYELVHFVPCSLWKQLKGELAGMEADTYICILGRENVTLEELDALQGNIMQTLEENDRAESENRIRQRRTNDVQIQGMMTIFGGFCVLLAVIGVGNVFSNTLGFIRQRKREIARYMSVGMTPREIRKMFCIEALVIAGRPILLTLPLAVIAVGVMLRASYLEVEVFLAEAPFVPVFVFMLAILGSVAFAYYLGWRGIRNISLAEVLKDDTMM